MNKTLQIFYIYADNCADCEATIENINEISSSHNIAIQLLKFRYDNQVALSIAVNNGIDDLPGIVIGEEQAVFQGKGISKQDLEEAILKAWNSIK